MGVSSGVVTLRGGSGNDAFSHDGVGLTFIDDASGASDLLLFSNVADLGMLDVLQNCNDIIFATQDDLNPDNAVVIRDRFSSSDSVDYIANANSTQILNLYDLFA